MCKLLGLGRALGVRHILGQLWGPLGENPLPSQQNPCICDNAALALWAQTSELSSSLWKCLCGGAVPPSVCLLVCVPLIFNMCMIAKGNEETKLGVFRRVMERKSARSLNAMSTFPGGVPACALICRYAWKQSEWKCGGGSMGGPKSVSSNFQQCSRNSLPWYNYLNTINFFFVFAQSFLTQKWTEPQSSNYTESSTETRFAVFFFWLRILFREEMKHEQDTTGCRKSEDWKMTDLRGIINGLVLHWHFYRASVSTTPLPMCHMFHMGPVGKVIDSLTRSFIQVVRRFYIQKLICHPTHSRHQSVRANFRWEKELLQSLHVSSFECVWLMTK